MKLLRFNKYKFITEGYSEFNQYNQGGLTPSSMGPGYGFAVDNKSSIYGQQDSPYTDQYCRTPMMVNSLLGVMKQINKDVVNNYGVIKYDQFLEDVDDYTELKILRLAINGNQNINIYISFFFKDEEFFGVFKNFNWIQKEDMLSDLFTDSRFTYINKEYRLKLNNYFRKILEKWFKPKKMEYIVLKELPVRDKIGDKFMLPINSKIEVKYSNTDKDGNSFIRFLYKGEIYVLNKNEYYYFNYWFISLEDKNK
jgi:hypothetical protein